MERFWTFQWIEYANHLGICVLASTLTFWLVQRRLS